VKRSKQVLLLIGTFATAIGASTISCKDEANENDFPQRCLDWTQCVGSLGLDPDDISLCQTVHAGGASAVACCEMSTAEITAACDLEYNGGDITTCVTYWEADICPVVDAHWGGSGGVADETGLDTNGEFGDDGVDESGGTPTCDSTWAVYECQGVVYGLHSNPTQGNRREFKTLKAVGHSNYYDCISGDDLPIIVPEQMMDDTQYLFDTCKAECLIAYGGHSWPADEGAWVLANNRCVFQDAPTGIVTGADASPDTQVGDLAYPADNILGPASCPFFDDPIMIPYIREATDEDCMAASCGDWNPNGNITTSTNSSTRTITTSMARSYLQGIYDNADDLYRCDQSSRFLQTDATPPIVENWVMDGMVSGDFLYRVGFRSGDKTLTIKQTGGTAMSLNNSANIVNAITSLYTYSSFVITFSRWASGPKVWQTWTLNLTLT
jgi:hypothetical protein